MKPKNNKDTVIVPSVDIILALLNNDPRNDLDFLEFYDGYIHAAATEPVYTAEGNRTGCFINEDLVQEIRIEFLKSLPPLRKKLMQNILCKEPDKIPVVIMISKESTEK